MTKKSRILYIDDDEDIIFIQKQILDKHGYDTCTFRHPEEALDHFRSQPDEFDIAIVDFVMPRMSGDLLASEIKKLNPRIPVILCTGCSVQSAKQQVQNLGLDGYLIKPITPQVMLETIDHLID